MGAGYYSGSVWIPYKSYWTTSSSLDGFSASYADVPSYTLTSSSADTNEEV